VYLEENNNARIIINTSYNNNKRYVRVNLPMSTSATHRQSWKQSTPSGEYIQTWDKASVGFAANIYVGDPIGVMHTSVAARMPRCHLAVRLYRNLRRFQPYANNSTEPGRSGQHWTSHAHWHVLPYQCPCLVNSSSSRVLRVPDG
jgi:hypothetical protein